jgi:hypothetical protein
MKPSLKHDFTVSVRHQIWEETPELGEFYQGIYSVILNFLVTIMFVPEVERTVDYWPPVLPENVDSVSTELEARLFTIALSDYTVTPNSLLAGKQELIQKQLVSEDRNNSNSVSKMGVLLYVSSQEFEVFSKELSDLAAQTPGVHDYVSISEIQNLELSKFILDSVIDSPHFSAGDLRVLGREDEYTKKLRISVYP